MPLFGRQPSFPSPDQANEEGLLAVGGRLTTDWVMTAYRSGIFPWPIVEGGREWLTWHSPDPRAVLPLDELHVPRRLARRLRRGEFRPTFDENFPGVISACAAPRQWDRGTWITPRMIEVYTQLHRQGHVHSVEVWQEGEIVGGIYGVAVGGSFSAESMFHRVRDASKAAIVFLVEHLRHRGFTLLDIQQWSPHTHAMGAREISREQFLLHLHDALNLEVSFI